MNDLTKKIHGWCAYCKDCIMLGEDFVVSEDKKYHIHCYDLVVERDIGWVVDNQMYINTDGDFE